MTFQEILKIRTDSHEGLYDITARVRGAIERSKVTTGLANIYARGATAAIMIQENWDASVRTDVINLLDKLIPQGIWIHDREDGNGAAHLKSGLIGPEKSVPVIAGAAGLSVWQNIFFCEFDGPRNEREIVVTVIGE